MERFRLASVDGVELDAAFHPAAAGAAVVSVVQFHGVNADMDEGGMFARLAEGLAGAGCSVLRVSFRGHGHSEGTQRGVTIAGEMLDVESAVERMVADRSGKLVVVAASFGAVPVLLSLQWLQELLSSLVLWNPVLDLRRTFLAPELPWSLENYGPAEQARLWSEGSLRIDGEAELGRVMFSEFSHYDPYSAFVRSTVPCLVVHGDRDSAVSYDIARKAAESRKNCDLHTVIGSDHGFDTRDREDEAIRVTIDWLMGRGRS